MVTRDEALDAAALAWLSIEHLIEQAWDPTELSGEAGTREGTASDVSAPDA